jgi:hypothetical protein
LQSSFGFGHGVEPPPPTSGLPVQAGGRHASLAISGGEQRGSSTGEKAVHPIGGCISDPPLSTGDRWPIHHPSQTSPRLPTTPLLQRRYVRAAQGTFLQTSARRLVRPLPMDVPFVFDEGCLRTRSIRPAAQAVTYACPDDYISLRLAAWASLRLAPSALPHPPAGWHYRADPPGSSG